MVTVLRLLLRGWVIYPLLLVVYRTRYVPMPTFTFTGLQCLHTFPLHWRLRLCRSHFTTFGYYHYAPFYACGCYFTTVTAVHAVLRFAVTTPFAHLPFTFICCLLLVTFTVHTPHRAPCPLRLHTAFLRYLVRIAFLVTVTYITACAHTTIPVTFFTTRSYLHRVWFAVYCLYGLYTNLAWFAVYRTRYVVVAFTTHYCTHVHGFVTHYRGYITVAVHAVTFTHLHTLRLVLRLLRTFTVSLRYYTFVLPVWLVRFAFLTHGYMVRMRCLRLRFQLRVRSARSARYRYPFGSLYRSVPTPVVGYG